MSKFLDKTGLDTFWAKIKSTFQTLGNLVTAWDSSPSDTKYPSEKLVKTSLDAKVSSIKKNETSITPTNGVVDIGYMPTTKEVESGSVQDTIQALRVVPGGAMGSVNLTASTVDSMSIPAGWYNYIWIPHRSGQSSSDNRNYGTLILTPMTTTPDEYIVEGSALGGSSPVYKARRMEQMNNKVSSWSSTTNNTRYPSEKLVKDYVDGKSWFKNTSNSGMQNSNAYYQCISAPTADFSGLVKLYDVTEFFDGTIVNQNERSVFFGDVSLIRDGGNAGCKYARVCAMIGFNNASSNIILQSDDDNAYPILVKEDFERLNVTGSIGAYVISNGVAVLDTARTRSRYFVVDCSTYSRMFINAGFYSPGSYSLNDVKAYIFANDSGTVLGNSESTNFDGYVDVPAGATKLYLHTNNAYSQVSVGPTTTSPKYFLAMRYAGWPAGTIEYFGRFYTRVTASAAYSARPLLLTFVQNLAPTGTTYIPSGYVIEKSATYTTHSNVANKLANARKLKTNLARTADSTFDGSADQTNIPVMGTLPVGNGGTGKASVTANSYLKGNGTGALVERTYAEVRTDLGLGSVYSKDVPTSGNASTSQVVMGNDSRLTDARTPTAHTHTADAADVVDQQGDSVITDSTDIITTHVNGYSSTNKKLYKRNFKDFVWPWIKNKISSVLGLTATAFGGNAATATALSAGADRTKLDGIAAGAEVNVQSDWNQATTTADDYIKNKPTIPSGTQLVYDCGTGSTSTTDFDNALAAFNAGNWVIIHSSGNTYHCVGTYNSGLRFKQIANETASIKVNTLNWTRGSAPSVGTQLEPSMPGHTHSQYVEKSGDTMSGNLTISKGANQGDTKFVASRTDTGTTGWFGIGDGGQNHGVYSEKAYANTNNEVDNDTKGWVVRTDENGYSTLTGAVDGLFSKYFGNTETLRGMKRFRFGYSLDLEGDYTHVGATAIIEVRIYSAGVSGGSITMLFNASAQGDARSYYRLQVLSSNNWNLNSVCPVLIVQQSSATAKRMILGFVSGGPTSTTLMTFNYTEVKVLPLNGARKFSWSFGWDTNDFNSNTMTMIKPYVYPRAQIGTAVGDANTPVYVKNDGSFDTASGVDVAVALKDAGRGDVAGTSGHIVKVGYDNSPVPATTPSGTSTYAAGATVGTTKNLVTSYRYDGVAFYKDVDSGNVTVGNSLKWNGYNLAIQNPGNTPAADTIYIF